MNRISRRFSLVIFLALVCGGLSGCGLAKKTRSLFGGTLPLRIEVASTVNHNSPLAVDVLVVYQKSFLTKMLELPARDYFSRREQLRRDYPDDYDVWSWEWVPGQEPLDLELNFRMGIESAVVFADYLDAGAHRVRLEPRKRQRLLFEENGFRVEEIEP